MTKWILGLVLCLLIATGATDIGAEEVPITLPACDLSDPEVKVIANDSDWGSANDPGLRIFCVQPGDYSDLGEILLTTSGSQGAPRFIVYDGASQPAHPAIMTEADRAIIGGLDFGAQWWVIDGLTIRGISSFIGFDSGADNNVLNRVLVEGGGSGAGQLNFGSADNTVVQNSVFRNTDLRPNKDTHCMRASSPTRGVKIIGNEIYNCAGDGLQVKISEEMTIADNDFYITPAIYSDCNGNLDPSGNCACAENAIDIKATVSSPNPSPEDWVRIINNRFWGFRETDSSCGGTGSGGDAVIVHRDGSYVLFQDNIVFDSRVGFNTPNERPHSLSIINNLFADISSSTVSGLRKSDSIEIYYNTVINSGKSVSGGDFVHELLCNVFIDAGSHSSDAIADFNVYYNSSQIANPGTNDLVFASAEDSWNADYMTTIRRHTLPTQVIIPNAVTTDQSPHLDHCIWAAVGVTFNLGVDDGLYDQPSAGFVPPAGNLLSIDIVSPTNGSSVSGIVTVQVDASDAEDVPGSLTVEVAIDGTGWQAAAYNSETGFYETDWDTTPVAEGLHTVNARADDGAGQTGNDSSDITVDNGIVNDVNHPPVAAFGTACMDLACNFIDGSSDGDGSVVAWAWDFGDGDASSAQNPNHTYAAGDTYTVTLTVTDDGDATDATSQAVVVSEPAPTNQPPTVTIMGPADGSSFTEGQFIAFDGTASDTEDGSLTPNLAWTANPHGPIGTGGSFSVDTISVGTHTITASVTDSGGLTGSAQITVTVDAANQGPGTFEVRVSASSDDAEERSSGRIKRSSSDLELVFDKNNQTVGLRFNGVNISQGAAITNAFVQFQVDEKNTVATSLTIQGENTDNGATFLSSGRNISSRARTAASVSWDPLPWTTKGEAGPDQRTPNIASIIQEVVNRTGWSSGNSLVIIITGTGERTAESFNGDQAGAPLLHVEYR